MLGRALPVKIYILHKFCLIMTLKNGISARLCQGRFVAEGFHALCLRPSRSIQLWRGNAQGGLAFILTLLSNQSWREWAEARAVLPILSLHFWP